VKSEFNISDAVDVGTAHADGVLDDAETARAGASLLIVAPSMPLESSICMFIHMKNGV
jgi:hypothetical protein